MNAQAAQACFADNFTLFGSNPSTTPENFNLYKGLTLLAKAIEDLDGRLSQIEAELSQIKQYEYVQAARSR